MTHTDLLIIKRNGTEEEFNLEKIIKALGKANRPLAENKVSQQVLEECANNIQRELKDLSKDKVTMEELEKILLDNLKPYPNLKESYCSYNKRRERSRLINSKVFKAIGEIAKETDRDNANVGNNFSSKLLRIASESNKYYNLAKMPKKISKQHEIGQIYQHDLDSYNLTINCLHIDGGKLLANGFNTGYGTLNPPKRITSAAALLCIILQASQNDMYGGQSFSNFDNDLAPYMRLTLREEVDKVADLLVDNPKPWADTTYNMIISNKYEPYSKASEHIINNTLKQVRQAMGTVVYNLNTMHSRAGSQVPFSSLNMGLPDSYEAYLLGKIFLEEYDKGLGKGEQPIFPNIIFRVKAGVNRDQGDPYYDLYNQACKVAARRMNPTFMNMDSSFNLPHYEKGNYPATMGCRTYLINNVNGDSVVEGRGNAASATINLARIGLEIKSDYSNLSVAERKRKYMERLDKYIENAKDSLLERYDVVSKLKVKDLPFSAGEGLLMGSEGLDKNDTIEPILQHSTWAIGFIALAEALQLVTGKHQGECEESAKFGYEIVSRIREKADEYTQQYKLNFSCYATPAEGLSGVFVKQDQEMYGTDIPEINKGYYTNSFHVPVNYEISIKKKLDIEAPYHSLCNGGHISYIEVDGYPTADIVEKIVTNAYKTSDISYLGINFHITYCRNCGHYLEIESCKVCDKCGSVDIQGISRVTGYLGLDERFGYGKKSEREDRVVHEKDI